MSNKWDYIIKSIKSDKKMLQRDNERLKIQIETSQYMIDRCTNQMNKNNEAIDSINDIIDGRF